MLANSFFQERKSIPIYIQKEQLPPSPKSTEYSLKNNLIDPVIGSPPNEWMMKLTNRIDTYYNEKQISRNEEKK